MTNPILPDYVAPYKPVPTVTPFTYRDGVTYLDKLDDMVRYLNTVIIPFVNTNYSELADDFETQVNLMINSVNQALAAQDASVDQKIADLTAYVDEQIAAIVGSSVTVQDPVVAGIFSNASSATRAVTDALYANKVATQASFDATNAAVATKAAQTALDATNTVVATKANQSALDTTNANVGTNTTDITALKGTVNDPGRLGPTNMNAQFAAATAQTLQVKRGGKYDVGLFTNLRNGIQNPAQTTRVVVLGDSHANGGVPPYPDQGVFQRLNYRCGSTDYRRLETVVPGPPTGMHWWSGSIGSTNSTNYFPSTYPSLIQILNPNYVLHLIGSNDHANGISPIDYANNITAICTTIEAQNNNAINVLIHGNQDLRSGTYSWQAYGDAMKSVVDANPTRRVYIDADDILSLLGLGSDNRMGFVSPDNIHMMAVGNKFMADVIGAQMGIPSESDFANMADTRPITFPGDTTYSGTSIITTINIEATNYPRIMDVEGVVFGDSGHQNNEIALQLIKISDNSMIKSYERRFTFTGVGGSSVDASGQFYIPPATAVKLQVVVVIVGASVIMTGSGPYTQAQATLSAV